MDIDRERLFLERKPTFTEVQAAQFYEENGEAISVDGRRAALDLFLVSFAFETSEIGPIPLNPLVARQLFFLLSQHGFGDPLP